MPLLYWLLYLNFGLSLVYAEPPVTTHASGGKFCEADKKIPTGQDWSKLTVSSFPV